MKRKIFSKLLMGAFLIASVGMFVSCKDYDDDINDLKAQINSLKSLVDSKEAAIKQQITTLDTSVKADIEALKTKLGSDITAGDAATLAAAENAIEEAKKALQAGIDANGKAIVDGDAATLAAAKQAVADAQAALEKAIADGDAAAIAAAKQAVADAETALQAKIDANAQAIADNKAATDASIAELVAKNNAQDEAIVKAQAAADQAQAQLDQLDKNLKAEVEKINAAFAEYDKKLEAAKKESADAVAQAKKEAADALAAAKKDIADQFGVVNGNIEKAAKAAEAAQGDATKALANIEKVSSDLSALEKRVVALESQMAQALKDITSLQTALAGQEAAIAAVKKTAENADKNATINGQNITTLTTELGKANGKIADLLTQLNAVETKLQQNINGQAANVGAELDGIKDQLKTVDALIAALQDAQKTFASKDDLNGVKTSLAGLSTNVSTLETDLDDLATNVNTLTTALAKALRSLVYQNTALGNGSRLYVDGIEAIQYPYIVDTLLAKSATYVKNRQRTHTGYVDDTRKTIRNIDDYRIAVPLSSEYFGPTWGVNYHMNPSKAAPTWSDVQGWARKDATIITRSTAGNNGAIQTAEKYADGTSVFGTRNGILTVGLKVTDPKNLADHTAPLEAAGRPGNTIEQEVTAGGAHVATATKQFDDMIALQVKTTENGEEKIITSDYAMIYPEKVWPEAIIWTKYDSKVGYTNVNFDEACPFQAATANKCHVWKTPEDALGVNNADVYPDIELYYDDADGIDLSKLLGIHYMWESKTSLNAKPGTWTFGSENFNRFGLKYKFELVDYTIDGNVTKDSKYCELTEAGVIKAKNVDAAGNTLPASSRTSVGREPLVRVIVSRGDRPILDGYILVHITETAPAEQSLLVDNYPVAKYTWNLCNGATVLTTNWSQFSNLVLHDKLNQMTKDNFDLQYGKDFPGVPDLLGIASEHNLLSDGSTWRYDDVVLFNDKVVGGKHVPGTQCNTRDLPGQVRYFHNDNSTTNHRFEWYVTGDELEEYTHENADYLTTARKIIKWFRYSRAAGQASDYQYIYVKLELDLTRGTIANKPIKTKNNNYWYKWDGNDSGWDAVVWNAPYPQDGGTTSGKTYNSTFTNALISTFVPNQVNFDNTAVPYLDNANATTRNAFAKFYFTPYEFDIKAQDGTVYTITPRSGNGDNQWNAFVCKYLRWENDGTPSYNHILNDGTYHNLHWYSATDDKTYTQHKWGTPAANKKTHQLCAIYYGSNVDPKLAALGISGGVYDNTTLYAVKKGAYNTTTAYTPIATLNPNITSGQMTLLWRTPDNDITKEVLNAIGYFKYDGQTESSADFQTHWNITKELNCMVGVIAHNGCGVALDIPEYVKDESNINAGTFYVTWQRPINVLSESKAVYDATNNGEKLYTVDFLQMFDWRGPTSGFMWGSNQWLWAYYDVKSFIIDTTPANVLTNMHQSSVDTKVKLSSVTTMANLYTLKADGTVQKGAVTIKVNNGSGSLAAYNAASQNDALRTLMGLVPANKAKKELFAGGIYYENNGDNVTDFDVWIPVTVNYEWGRFLTNVKVHIHRTLGN